MRYLGFGGIYDCDDSTGGEWFEDDVETRRGISTPGLGSSDGGVWVSLMARKEIWRSEAELLVLCSCGVLTEEGVSAD